MKRIQIVISVILLLLICTFIIRIPIQAPGDTRLILEMTHQTYIAPACFEKAEATNNLVESTYARAVKLDLVPESDCTESLMKGKTTLFDAALIKLGLTKGEWNW